MSRPTHLGEFETIALVALKRLQSSGAEAYGVPIRREAEQLSGRSVSIGALHTTLSRLETKGLVASRQGPSSPTRGGRSKRLFELTAAGSKALAESLRTMQRLMLAYEGSGGGV